jgi:hypothetical protein
MDERYRTIYAAIYVGRTGELGVFAQRLAPDFALSWPGGFQASAVRTAVRDAIEGAEGEVGRRVREDAKALLAVNFEDMVLYPLLVGGRQIEEILDDAAADIRMLIRSAAEHRDQRGVADASDDSTISGHAVIDALSTHWSELRISRYRLWERSDGD